MRTMRFLPPPAAASFSVRNLAWSSPTFTLSKSHVNIQIATGAIRRSYAKTGTPAWWAVCTAADMAAPSWGMMTQRIDSPRDQSLDIALTWRTSSPLAASTRTSAPASPGAFDEDVAITLPAALFLQGVHGKADQRGRFVLLWQRGAGPLPRARARVPWRCSGCRKGRRAKGEASCGRWKGDFAKSAPSLNSQISVATQKPRSRGRQPVYRTAEAWRGGGRDAVVLARRSCSRRWLRTKVLLSP